MTLDEAIKHCTEIVDECMKECEKVPECHHGTYAPYVRTKERATEYAHYVEWLDELKYYREQGDALREIRQEIECNMESIIGKYDKSTPTRDLPSYKIERNESRKECIKLIDSKIKELSK